MMQLFISTAAAPNIERTLVAEAAERRGIALIDVAHIAADALVLNAAQEDVYAAYLNSRRARCIVLRGGGPEAAYHEGRGIGALMARLALDGYDGSVVLEPSSAAALPVWRAWLTKGRNWGCGSKQQDASLAQLA